MPSLRPSARALFASLTVGGVPLLLGAEGVSLLPIIVSGVGALATYLITIAMRVRAARKEARAKFLEEQAALQLADNDPANDTSARELKLLAAEERAEALALNDLSDRRPRL